MILVLGGTSDSIEICNLLNKHNLSYFVSVTTVGAFVTDWTNDVLFGDIIPPAIEKALVAVNCADWLQGLILDGIVAGVGAVLGFVPQMLVLFIFLAFLEGCGYMARVAFIMDRIFRKFGLSGKSFIPMLIGSWYHGIPYHRERQRP